MNKYAAMFNKPEYNTDHLNQDIVAAIEAIRVSIPTHWTKTKVTQKAVARVEELGLAEYFQPADLIPGKSKTAEFVNAVIKAAEDAGGERVSESLWHDGDASVITGTNKPSALWVALNPDQGPDAAPQTDEEIIEEWLQQAPPAPSDLTQDDVRAAFVALEVLQAYHNRGTWYSRFEIGRSSQIFMGVFHGDIAHDEAMSIIKRGVAVCNGYLLVSNERVPVYIDAPAHPQAIVSRYFGAGYIALTEYHRTISLLPADDLMTITDASQLMYSVSNQSNRMSIKSMIRDGALQPFWDMSEPNSQHQLRVSRKQVLRLAAIRND